MDLSWKEEGVSAFLLKAVTFVIFWVVISLLFEAMRDYSSRQVVVTILFLGMFAALFLAMALFNRCPCGDPLHQRCLYILFASTVAAMIFLFYAGESLFS